MRLALNNLLPGASYAIQVRAKNSEGTSEWSRRVVFTTINDEVLPNAPTGVTWAVAGNGFHAEWNSVTTNTNNDVIPVTRYEVQLVASGATKYVSVPQATGTKNSFDLSFEQNVALFGTARPSITIFVRAVDNKELKSSWSAAGVATNPAPATPSSITGVGAVDSISLKWSAVADLDLTGYRVHVGNTSGFTPSESNRIYFGDSTEFTYATTTYTDVYFKVAAVDIFGQISGYATSGALKPNSPFTVDTTAPGVPTNLAVNVTNNVNGLGARAAVTWTNPVDTDLSGTEIQYKRSSDTSWSSVQAGKDTTSTTLELPYAYTAYDFRIRARDWTNNYSAWSTTLAKPAVANTAPSNVSGLSSIVGRDSIRYSWTAVSDADLKEYEVTFSTSADFSTSPITFKTGTANYLTVSGLNPSTTYYARVRAVDNGGLNSAAWSTTNTSTTLSYSANTSDGVAPTSSPAVNVTAGISYIYATWPVITNNDPVTYEVHVSTASGFTPSVSTKVAETSGTSQVIRILNDFSSVVYGTTYYVRIVAKDVNGPAAPGTQGSATLQKAAVGDINITPGDIGAPTNNDLITVANGKNKTTYSSTSPGTTSNTAGDTWFRTSAGVVIEQWEGTGGTSWSQKTIGDTVIANLSVGKLISGEITGAEFIVSTGGIIRTENDSVIITQYGIQLTAGATIDAAADVNVGALRAGTINTSGDIVVGSTIRSTNFSTTAGYQLSSTGLIIRQGEVAASTLRAGTLTSDTGVIQVGTGASLVFNGGYLKSNTYTGTSYSATAGAGWYLGNDGLRIANGSVSASAITAGTISGTNTIALSGANAKITGTGFELSGTGLLVNTGSIAAAALAIQSPSNVLPYITSTFDASLSALPYTTTGSVTVSMDSTKWALPTLGSGKGQSLKVVNGNTTVNTVALTQSNGFDIPVLPGETYIFSGYVNADSTNAWSVVFYRNDTNAQVAALSTGALSVNTWTRFGNSFTVPAGVTLLRIELKTPGAANTANFDCFQLEKKVGALNSPSVYQVPGVTNVDGSMITTGEIRSNNNITINGISEPIWSIPKNGAATFAAMRVLGNTVLGNGINDTASMLSSASYVAGTSGWRITASGAAEFNDVTVRGNVQGNANSVFNGGTVTGATVTGGVVQTGSNNVGTVRLSSTGDNGFLAYREDGQIGVRIPRTGLFQGSLVVDWGGLVINSPNNFINNGGTLWALGQSAELAGVYTSLSGGILKTGTWLGGSGFNTGYPEIVTSPTEIRFRSSATNGGQAGYSSSTNSAYLDSLQNVFIRAQNGSAEVNSVNGLARVIGTNATITSSALTQVFSGDTILLQSNNSSGGAVAIEIAAPNGGGIVIGSSSAGGSVLSPKIMGTTTSAAANVNIAGSGGTLTRSTSSRRYKADIKTALIDSYKILDIEPVTWLDKAELLEWDESRETMPGRYFGAIAEQVHDAGITEVVVYNEEDKPEALSYDRMFVYSLPMLKDMHQRLTASEEENTLLREELNEMKTMITELKKLLPGS